MRRVLGVALLTAAALSGCRPYGEPARADQVSAEVAIRYMRLTLKISRSQLYSPPVASRFMGYVGIALYEGVVPGITGGRSLAGKLNGLDSLPRPAPGSRLDWRATANAAAAMAMRHLMKNAEYLSRNEVDSLERFVDSVLAISVDKQVLAQSREYGRKVGEAIGTWAASDGAAKRLNCKYEIPPPGNGRWEMTPPGWDWYPLQPCWGQVRTFMPVPGDGPACPVLPHAEYSTDPKSKFFGEAHEVFLVKQDISEERKHIASWWADDVGATFTPPGHWLAILHQVAERKPLPLSVAAEAYARVGIAIADAFIACWRDKYRYNLMRPISYINQNIDPGWRPYVPTPLFPEYPSGHSTVSAAAAEALTGVLGEVAFTDSANVELGYPPRKFASFWAAAREAAISRLYGGIHYRMAIENGIDQGRCIGSRVNALWHPDSGSLAGLTRP